MKKLLILLLLGVPLASCDLTGDEFLAPQNSSALTEEMVFSDSIRTTAFLTRIYSDIGVDFELGIWSSHGNINQATDDAEYTLSSPTQTAVIHYSGTLNPATYASDGNMNLYWRMPYENIRRVNMLIANIDRSPLTQATKTRMLAEARFLRAWYYAGLMKRYGGVPILENKVFTALDVVNVPRNTYAECVEYVVNELDAVAAVLQEPQQQPDQFYGRANAGAALGLKSRVLLYAASPLFNGGAIEVAKGTPVEPIISYPNYDVARWQRAADAAQELINKGWYSLHVNNETAPGYGFYEVFLRRGECKRNCVTHFFNGFFDVTALA
ncbi:RagB/SusD family nutrient uptake outer membrane protein [Botryobacter ruber]|uniref:RagB/SusD family nutrient uptake outer membrane protein n=1 Tax=Botryobacter ruber TaxID=2171629 RepID=UPI000E0C30D6|nr:RagB/SusD family nutrient uptake outer membrane protein [Botryobacter ruber]